MQQTAGSKVLWALLIFFLFTFQSSFGDKIILKNGSTFEGKIIKETDRVVILKISGMGKMTFQKSQISQILREKPSEKKEPTKKEGKAKKVPLFLWKVKGKEAYLFGTIHGYVNIYALSPTPLEKLKSSLYVILETDLKKIDRALIQKYGFFPKGESLDQKLPKDLWEKVKKALPNAPKDRLKKIKPWVLNFILGTKYHPSGSVAMDATLYNEALKAKITLEFLETPDEQFQMLDKVHQVNPQKTIDELQEMLDQPSKYKKKVQTLAKLYKKGDP
ncbi:MAG: TraB/GumN family protein, partial [Planctomycetota bacterium]